MPGAYELTALAADDRDGIWLHIACDNPAAADRVDARLENAFALLAENPYLGHKREDLTGKPVRFHSVYHYMIIYLPDTNPLQIVRILSSYRDIATLL